jgi:DNA repair protein RadC
VSAPSFMSRRRARRIRVRSVARARTAPPAAAGETADPPLESRREKLVQTLEIVGDHGDFVCGAPGGTASAFSLDMMSSTSRPASITTRPAWLHPRRRGGAPPDELLQRALHVGVDHLDDEELVALLVDPVVDDARIEANDRAARVFEEAGGLGGLASRGIGALACELKLPLACAARLAAAVELGIRVAALARDPSLDAATSAADVERWGRARLVALPHEELWALLLDTRNRIIGERMIARGGLHAMAITARDVLRPVVREAVSAFVLVHNHPGGDPCPSQEDVTFTSTIASAAATLGMILVDHVVVAREASVSMLESGLMDRLA